MVSFGGGGERESGEFHVLWLLSFLPFFFLLLHRCVCVKLNRVISQEKMREEAESAGCIVSGLKEFEERGSLGEVELR